MLCVICPAREKVRLMLAAATSAVFDTIKTLCILCDCKMRGIKVLTYEIADKDQRKNFVR